MEDLGPVQILVVGFDDLLQNREILEELDVLRDRDIIRLIDLVVVEKDPSGDVKPVDAGEPGSKRPELTGALVGGLIGLGEEVEAGTGADAPTETDQSFYDDEEERWAIADAIPMGKTAAVALLEHRWAIPLRDAIRRAGGTPLADTWIHPEDLSAVGTSEASKR
jgi:uncharacterized membrane protein